MSAHGSVIDVDQIKREFKDDSSYTYPIRLLSLVYTHKITIQVRANGRVLVLILDPGVACTYISMYV